MSGLIDILSMSAHALTMLSLAIIGMKSMTHEREAKWFSLFLLLAVSIQIIARIMWGRGINNLLLLHIYTLLEFIFLTLFYQHLLIRYNFLKKYVPIWLSIVSILIIANSIFIQPIDGFNNNAKTLTQVTYMAYAITYFYHEIAEYKKNIRQQLLTRINSAILVYYSSSLFIFMFSNFIPVLGDGYKAFWVINAVLYLIFQLIIFVSLIMYKNQQKAITN